MSDQLLTTEEAAARLGVTAVRVRAMIGAGRLPAQKFGHVHMIKVEDLKLVADRKVGRPPNKSPTPNVKRATAPAKDSNGTFPRGRKGRKM